jgi:HlyD family secretion protein
MVQAWISRTLVMLVTSLALSAHAEEPTKKNTPIVVVEKAALSNQFDILTFPAHVHSTVNASVTSPSDGTVVAILAPVGKQVGQMQGLLVVQNTDPGYQFAPVTVVSPVRGVVGDLTVTVGARVSRGQVLASVVDPRKLELQCEVPQGDAWKLKTGMKGQFALGLTSASEATNQTVSVVSVSPIPDAGTGTVTVSSSFAGKASNEQMLGTLGRLSFQVNQRSAVRVPEESIVYRGTDTFIRKVQDNKVSFAKVAIAKVVDGLAELKEGVANGDVVVIRANAFVDDGQEVVIQESDVAKK